MGLALGLPVVPLVNMKEARSSLRTVTNTRRLGDTVRQRRLKRGTPPKSGAWLLLLLHATPTPSLPFLLLRGTPTLIHLSCPRCAHHYLCSSGGCQVPPSTASRPCTAGQPQTCGIGLKQCALRCGTEAA